MTQGWCDARKTLIASQVESIRHWRVLEASYADLPNPDVTWFVDPPYDNAAGRHYKHNVIDYAHLGEWCRARRGQVIVCENVGAAWLPFEPFRSIKSFKRKTSAEAIWRADSRVER